MWGLGVLMGGGVDFVGWEAGRVVEVGGGNGSGLFSVCMGMRSVNRGRWLVGIPSLLGAMGNAW